MIKYHFTPWVIVCAHLLDMPHAVNTALIALIDDVFFVLKSRLKNHTLSNQTGIGKLHSFHPWLKPYHSI